MISSEANVGAEADFSKSGESRSRTVSSSARWSSSAILVSVEEEAMATKTASNQTSVHVQLYMLTFAVRKDVNGDDFFLCEFKVIIENKP